MSMYESNGKYYLAYDEDGSEWEIVSASKDGIVLKPLQAALKAGHKDELFTLERYGCYERLEWFDEIVHAFHNGIPK